MTLGYFELGGRAEVFIGHTQEEREKPQSLYWQLRYSLRLPSQDLLEETIDYSIVQNKIEEYLSTTQVRLLETLGQGLIESLFAAFAFQSATLRLHKERTGALFEVSR